MWQVRNSFRSKAFDQICHPLRVDPSVYRFFANQFEKLLYSLGPGRRGDRSLTLIGRKWPDPKAKDAQSQRGADKGTHPHDVLGVVAEAEDTQTAEPARRGAVGSRTPAQRQRWSRFLEG